jgi:hypothetical protein
VADAATDVALAGAGRSRDIVPMNSRARHGFITATTHGSDRSSTFSAKAGSVRTAI